MDSMALRKDIEQITVEGYSLEELNLLVGIEDKNQTVTVKIYKTALNMENREYITRSIMDLAGQYGFKKTEIEYIEKEPQYINRIGKVIAVMSGKGGVGKSSLAALTAISLNRAGYKVGILDADVTGPSMPKMFNVNGRPQGNELGFLPISSKSDIRVISINLLLNDANNAVIWRGGMVSKAILQFWTDVLWGNLDYLVVDMPPGTSDAALTVLGAIPVSGVLMVYTPQDLAAMIVRKALNMVEKMNKTVIGLVENMSYITVPQSGQRLYPFGQNRNAELQMVAKAPVLGVFPLDSDISAMADEGRIEDYISPELEVYQSALLEAVKILPVNEPTKEPDPCDDRESMQQGGCNGISCDACSPDHKNKHHSHN